MKLGIVGLLNVGKTTLFNALTGAFPGEFDHRLGLVAEELIVFGQLLLGDGLEIFGNLNLTSDVSDNHNLSTFILDLRGFFLRIYSIP